MELAEDWRLCGLEWIVITPGWIDWKTISMLPAYDIFIIIKIIYRPLIWSFPLSVTSDAQGWGLWRKSGKIK